MAHGCPYAVKGDSRTTCFQPQAARERHLHLRRSLIYIPRSILQNILFLEYSGGSCFNGKTFFCSQKSRLYNASLVIRLFFPRSIRRMWCERSFAAWIGAKSYSFHPQECVSLQRSRKSLFFIYSTCSRPNMTIIQSDNENFSSGKWFGTHRDIAPLPHLAPVSR